MSNIRRVLGIASVLWAALPAAAQLPGNGALQGAYYVRYLGVDTYNHPQSFQGTFTFDGKGGFQVAGQAASSASSDHSLKFAASGTYQVLSSGLVNLSNPFEPSGKTRMHGGIGAGMLFADSRDSLYDDFLVAIPASTAASNATLNGTYRVASVDFLNGDPMQTRGTFFSMSADGKGSLGNVTVTGTAIKTIQTDSGATASPGVFTMPAGGVGDGAVLHAADYSLVSKSNPAKPGETVLVYLTGLGPVTPAVAAGAASPSSPLSTVPDGSYEVDIDGNQAAVSYAGLAPGLGGLYQLNVATPRTRLRVRLRSRSSAARRTPTIPRPITTSPQSRSATKLSGGPVWQSPDFWFALADFAGALRRIDTEIA